MSVVQTVARAPSNIALIKYMGKSDRDSNLPANGSLSLTLRDLCTITEVRRVLRGGSGMAGAAGTGTAVDEVRWIPEAFRHVAAGSVADQMEPVVLSADAIDRVTRHLRRARAACAEIFPAFGLRCHDGASYWEIRSANTFPAASGIASSASSFAALTLATAQACAADPEAFARAWDSDRELHRALARLSRQGSGSSCRSFEGPWVLWRGTDAAALDFSSPDLGAGRMPEMADLVILVESAPKAVSSSQAHQRVQTSPLWAGRPERAEGRLEKMIEALRRGELAAVSRLAWQEAWEMHSLFHTAEEPFTYWRPGTLEILNGLRPFVWPAESGTLSAQPGQVPPIVTLDAGPNVHVLVPATRAPEWRERLRSAFPAWRILEDVQGLGAEGVR